LDTLRCMSLRVTLSGRSRGRRSAAIGAVSLAAVVVLASCGTGQSWVTQGLDPSGNGVYTTVGSVQAQNLTLVQGPEGAKALTLIGSFINKGTSPDAIVGATLGDSSATAATLSSQAIELAPLGELTKVGYDESPTVSFFNAEVPTSTYVPVTIKFGAAGQTTVNLLVVPATGVYEGISPGTQPS